jgi:hypothetical protein
MLRCCLFHFHFRQNSIGCPQPLSPPHSGARPAAVAAANTQAVMPQAQVPGPHAGSLEGSWRATRATTCTAAATGRIGAAHRPMRRQAQCMCQEGHRGPAVASRQRPLLGPKSHEKVKTCVTCVAIKSLSFHEETQQSIDFCFITLFLHALYLFLLGVPTCRAQAKVEPFDPSKRSQRERRSMNCTKRHGRGVRSE